MAGPHHPDPGTSLCVVVCTHDRSASLVETLASLAADASGGEAPLEVLVVANHCRDDTLERLAAFAAEPSSRSLQLAWIDEPQPGKSFALNRAIAHTQHEVLCFIDDDQTVEPGFVRQLRAGLREHPAEDLYCGRIRPAWDGSEPSWVHAGSPHRIPIRPFPEFDRGDDSLVLGTGDRMPSGGNLCVRRRVFDRVGVFSTTHGPTGHNLEGGEDHEFLSRALAAGHRVRYLPGVRQLHAIDPTRMATLYVLRKSYLRSRASCLIHHPSAVPRAYMLRKILSHFAQALASLGRERRFYMLVRAAASLGELSAAMTTARRARSGLPREPRAS